MLAAVLLMLGQAASERVQVLEFGASWCGPCQQQAPVLAQLERAGWKIIRADFDRERSTANAWRVQSLPTIILLRDGREAKRFTGYTPYDRLSRELSALVPVPAKSPFSSRVSTLPSAPQIVRQAGTNALIAWWLGAAPIAITDLSTVELPFIPNAVEPTVAAPSISEIALASHVRIKVDYAREILWGSGTVIHTGSKNAMILTNKHVTGRGPCTIQIDDGTSYYKGIRVGELWPQDNPAPDDMAVLRVHKPAAASAKLCSIGHEIVEPIWVVGSPEGRSPNLRPAKLVRRCTLRNGGVDLVIGGGFIDGESGGAVYDSTGTIVGVIRARSPDMSEGYAVDLTRSRWLSPEFREMSQGQ